MLGAINPMGDVPVSFGQPQTFSTGARQSVVTLPANQRQYVLPVNTSPVAVEQPSSPAPDATQGTDYMAMVKKYAPYVIGAVVLYYLILKNKK
jgi:hypothetical protein